MRYCEISKERSSLYFGLAVFCLFEARVPEFKTQPPPPPTAVEYAVYTEHRTLRQILGVELRTGRIQPDQNTTTTYLTITYLCQNESVLKIGFFLRLKNCKKYLPSLRTPLGEPCRCWGRLGSGRWRTRTHSRIWSAGGSPYRYSRTATAPPATAHDVREIAIAAVAPQNLVANNYFTIQEQQQRHLQQHSTSQHQQL
jgi:hypothetical protein